MLDIAGRIIGAGISEKRVREGVCVNTNHICAGLNVNNTCNHMSALPLRLRVAERGHANIGRVLLDQGAGRNSDNGPFDMTPLILAARKGSMPKASGS